MGRGRTFFGVLLSAIYLIWVAVLVLPKLCSLTQMDLNSIGDFLAGIFGPLAFLWLVLGYFQQGSELKQNNEALKMQASELKASVNQQVAMVEAQNKSLNNYDKALSPLLKLNVDPYDPRFIEGERYISMSIQNLGEYCERVSGRVGNDLIVSFPTSFKDEIHRFWFSVENYDLCDGIDVRFDYRNRNGVEGSQSFTLNRP